MQDIALLAIDWGTSTTRAYAMDQQGRIRNARTAPLGVQRVAQGEFAQALKTLYGDELPDGVPLIACGMIGSRQGWVEAPYRECPAGFDAIASALTRVPGTRVPRAWPSLPRRAWRARRDARRGNEGRGDVR